MRLNLLYLIYPSQVNTYQVAISSNGTHSFVELLYPENGIQWIQAESHPSGLPDAKAQAGFMSEGRITTLQGSGTDQIQNVDKWVLEGCIVTKTQRENEKKFNK